MSVCLLIYLSIRFPLNPRVFSPFYLFTCLLSTCLSVYPCLISFDVCYIHLCFCLPAYLFIFTSYLFFYVYYIYLCFCIPAYLFIYLSNIFFLLFLSLLYSLVSIYLPIYLSLLIYIFLYHVNTGLSSSCSKLITTDDGDLRDDDNDNDNDDDE